MAQLKEKAVAIAMPKTDEESEEDEAEPAVAAAVSVATQQPVFISIIPLMSSSAEQFYQATKVAETVAVSVVAEETPAVATKEEEKEKEEKKEEKEDDFVPDSRFSRFATFDLVRLP